MMSTRAVVGRHLSPPPLKYQRNVHNKLVRQAWTSTWPKVAPKRVRLITCDVTGTLVSFRGTLEEHYLGAALKCGVSNIERDQISPCFHEAYKQVSRKHPCFGNKDMTSKEWWRQCVSLSFRLAGVDMDKPVEENIFQRIYSTFGSHAAYEVFPDALPFLNWAARNGITCGVLSNADERYGDSILPMLGLTHDELMFQCFSKDLNLEKPDARIYMAAIEKAKPWTGTPCLPSEVVHIGNDYIKDFDGARRAGMHAVLLDRYNETELANEWRRRGALVFEDLLDVVEFLGRRNCRLG